jgi:hypothetical protein
MSENYVTFTLKDKQANEKDSSQRKTLIYLNFSYGYYTGDSESKTKKYKPLKYSTSKKVKPYQFLGKPTYRVKQNAKTDVIGINNELQRISNAILSIHKELSENRKVPTPEELRNELDVELGRKNAKPRIRNKDFLNNYFDIYENGILTGKILTKHGQKFVLRSVKDFGYFRKLWNYFEAKQGKQFRYDDIDFKFYQEFLNFLTLSHKVNGKTVKQEFMNATINKMLRWFNVIMGRTRNLGYHNNDIVERPEWKLLPEGAKAKIALSQSELKKLEDLELPYKSYLDSIRDTWLVGTYIAQRYQDYSILQEINFVNMEKEDGEIEVFIHIIQKKGATNNDVYIPLWPPLEIILKKWEYSLPKIGHKQFGRYIKELGEKAGIDSSVTYEFIKGGKKRIETKKKYELIVPHTPRRTGISVMDDKMPDSQVKKISGHITDAAYQRYIKKTKKESALELANYNPF